MCARHDVGAIFNFIVGFPDEPDEASTRRWRSPSGCARMSPRFETPIFYYRPYPGNPIADEARRRATCFRAGLEAWADFDYVGGRGPWVSADRWRQVERFKFYTRHAWQPSGRGAGRCAPPRAGAASTIGTRFPVEKALVELVRPPQQVS